MFPPVSIPATGEADVASVADVSRYVRKPQEIRQLRPLRHEIDKRGKTGSKAVAAGVAATLDTEADAIEERAAIISETCPAPYADTFARLNNQKPLAVSDADWRQAFDDAGRFLDTWGADAATLQWAAGDLFDVPREGRPGGLAWQLRGQRVGALGEDHARLDDGRFIKRRAR